MREPQLPSCCLTNSPSSSGELGAGSAKNWTMRSLMAGLASALLVAAFSAWITSWEVPAGANEGDQPPDAQQARQLAFRSSPNSAIATWSSPVLLIQGDDDRNVSFSQSVDLAQRLKAQRVPFEQIVFPDEIHDFLLWHSWVRAYDAGEKFFTRLLVQGEKLPPPQ